MKKYLPWIDNAKGIGIFSVLLSHTGLAIFHQPENIINHFIPWFYMPLFFMAAGYVAYKPISQIVSLRSLFVAKNFCLLIPFFVFGIIYTVLLDYSKNGILTENPLTSLLTSGRNNGYWFLLFLFVFRYITLLGRFFLQKKVIKRISGLFFLFIVFFCLFYFQHTYIYYVFYLIGMYFRKNSKIFGYLQLNDTIIGCVFLFVVAVAFAREMYDLPLGFAASLFMMLLFTPCVFISISKTESGGVIRFFNYVGHRSLEIYVIHYFFLMQLNVTGYFDFIHLNDLPFVLQLFLFFTCAFLILLPTLLCEKIINSNRFLQKILLGKF